MKPIDRRTFLAGGAAAALLTGLDAPAARPATDVHNSADGPQPEASSATVDFRYAPEDFQSTICFPDDPAKTVVGK